MHKITRLTFLKRTVFSLVVAMIAALEARMLQFFIDDVDYFYSYFRDISIPMIFLTFAFFFSSVFLFQFASHGRRFGAWRWVVNLVTSDENHLRFFSAIFLCLGALIAALVSNAIEVVGLP